MVFEVGGDCLVTSGTVRFGDRLVGDLPNQIASERPPLTVDLDQVVRHQDRQCFGHTHPTVEELCEAFQCFDHASTTEHGSVLQYRARTYVEVVEPGGDESSQVVWEGFGKCRGTGDGHAGPIIILAAG